MNTLERNLLLEGHYLDSPIYGLVIGDSKTAITYVDLNRIKGVDIKLYNALMQIANFYIDTLNLSTDAISFKSFIGDNLYILEKYIVTIIKKSFIPLYEGCVYYQPTWSKHIGRKTKRPVV